MSALHRDAPVFKAHALDVARHPPVGKGEVQTALHHLRIRHLEAGDDGRGLRLRAVEGLPPCLVVVAAARIHLVAVDVAQVDVLHVADAAVCHQQFVPKLIPLVEAEAIGPDCRSDNPSAVGDAEEKRGARAVHLRAMVERARLSAVQEHARHPSAIVRRDAEARLVGGQHQDVVHVDVGDVVGRLAADLEQVAVRVAHDVADVDAARLAGEPQGTVAA